LAISKAVIRAVAILDVVIELFCDAICRFGRHLKVEVGLASEPFFTFASGDGIPLNLPGADRICAAAGSATKGPMRRRRR